MVRLTSSEKEVRPVENLTVFLCLKEHRVPMGNISASDPAPGTQEATQHVLHFIVHRKPIGSSRRWDCPRRRNHPVIDAFKLSQQHSDCLRTRCGRRSSLSGVDQICERQLRSTDVIYGKGRATTSSHSFDDAPSGAGPISAPFVPTDGSNSIQM
jgi:hypothetical protein